MSSTREAGGGRLTAVLGPTNTGKTFMAMERMLAHRSGMVGFPLRLLARENYERAAATKGKAAVALVTGEEKIVPPEARYFLCTVEAMPLDRGADFLAVDEIQLAADAERGHVFTERLLEARGREETMFMGAQAMAPWVRLLAPGIGIVERPRFSTLSYAGVRKITRLPPRSAVVAFSAGEVYAIAELIRRQRGGAAIVMGALSPRTRNAQVALYQAGEVDYLVATDAIGMGLNLDVRHVAFASLRKFDGNAARDLTRAEIGQIAGRAGRHMSDGTFGATAELGAIDPETVTAIEAHRFEPIAALMWRNHDLDFRSPRHLLASLGRRPPHPGLIRQRGAEDHRALLQLARDPAIAELAQGAERVRLLWEVCQIPDFRKLLAEDHIRLLGRIYRHLAEGGRLPADWVAGQMARLDRYDGDIERLTQRIAHIRTWSYVAHRGDWLAEPAHWQERAQGIEDRLSDALHEALTQRFVDRRQAALQRSMKSGDALAGAVSADGTVAAAGHDLGRLVGLHFQPSPTERAEAMPALLAAARRILVPAVAARVAEIAAAPDGDFALDPGGALLWRGQALARLARGNDPLRPAVILLASDLIDGRQRQAVEQRLRHWLAGWLRANLAPLFALAEAPAAALSPPVRGLAYRLSESFGALPRASLVQALRALQPADKKALAALGVRRGRATVWLTGLDQRRRRWLLGQLAAIWLRLPRDAQGRLDAATLDPAALAQWQMARGRRILAKRAFSFAALEAKLAAIEKARTASLPVAEMAKALHLGDEELAALLALAGRGKSRAAARARRGRARRGLDAALAPEASRPSEASRPPEVPRPPNPHSPFAALAAWRERRR